MLSKNPKVQFAGYCVPHPSEAVMNVRVQCEKDTRAELVVDQALGELASVFTEISSSFEKALVSHQHSKKH